MATNWNVKSPADYAALSRGLRAILYTAALANPDQRVLRLFYPIQTSNPEEVLSIMKGIPQMREWVGDRLVKNLTRKQIPIEKKDWEATIGVNVDDLKFDKLDQVRAQIRLMARSYVAHFVKFAKDLMLGGFTSNAYDGQFFFDTDHVGVDGASVSNKSTATFSAAAWATAQSEASKLADEDSEFLLNVQWNHIFYGPLAEAAVMTTFGQRVLASGEENIYLNAIPAENRIKFDELGSTAKWFLFDLRYPELKPFALMIVGGLNSVAKDAPTDDNVFWSREMVYGIDSTDNADYMLWEVAYGSTAGE